MRTRIDNRSAREWAKRLILPDDTVITDEDITCAVDMADSFIPLTAYAHERADGKLTMLSPLHTVTALIRFIKGEAAWEGNAFDSLAPKLQNRIDGLNITMVVLSFDEPVGPFLDIIKAVR